MPRPALPLFVALLVAAPTRAADPDFEKTIAPILLGHCLECHAGAEAAGGLDLTTAKGVAAGGKSGAAVMAGKPGESFLIERVTAGEMPPAKKGKPQPLAKEDVERLRTWVAAGAAWPAGRTLD